jgi:signal transduction histidine kinase
MYGGLFLACGAVLLAVTYVLAEQAIAPGGNVNLRGLSQATMPSGLSPFAAGQFDALKLTLGKAIANSDLQQVLIQAPIALAIVTVVALALGWVVAGRVLRPLATISGAARRISASNLHERLSLRGPADELKSLGDTLDDLFARLEASFEAQRNFVANASHELRTPLTRERAMLQVALDDPDTTTETWRAVSREVLASNTEQESLIEALLTLASSQGGLDQREPVDMAAITSQALQARRPEVCNRGLRIETDARPAAVDGDPLLIERLAANLIDNAMRHNIPGGAVKVTTTTDGGRPVLSVASTGPVIPPADVVRLFQPFQRLQTRRAPDGQGHGLGLSIVRAIAAAHDATIEARALPAGGLAIEITFPLPTPPPPPHRLPHAGLAVRV